MDHKYSILNSIIFSLLVTLVFFIVLYFLYTPIYDTNDDVVMSMISNGYGISYERSSHIMFSNIIYGSIVSTLPNIYEINAYSYMTFLMLLLSCFIMIFCFERLNKNRLYLLSIFVVMNVAFCSPQFTLNSGFLSISGIISILVYLRLTEIKYLIIGIFSLYLGYLVRMQEMILIVAIAIPLLISKKLFFKRAIIVQLVFFLVCLSSYFLNIYAYKSPDYVNYDLLTTVRVPFNDFRASDFFLRRPDILQKYGFTPNDMNLLHKFIFVDEHLIDYNRLQDLLSNFTFNHRLKDNIGSLKEFVFISFFNPLYGTLFITSGMFLFLAKNKIQLVLSWGILFAVIVVFILLGRPLMFRVLYPVIAMVLIVSCIDAKQYNELNYIFRYVVALVLVIATITNMFVNSKLNSDRLAKSKLAYQDYEHLSSNSFYFVRGGDLPYEYIFLPLGKNTYNNPILYAFITSYYLPGTYSNKFVFTQYGFESMFSNNHTIRFIGTDQTLDYVRIYCHERYNKFLQTQSIIKFNTFNLYDIVCH